MDPASLQIPEQFESLRLILRATRLEDAVAINRAVQESFADLKPWMIWAQHLPTLSESQEHCRDSRERFLARQEFGLQIRLKSDDTLVGMTGFHQVDWSVPKLEIGYWGRTGFGGRGYITEAVQCLTRIAFELFQVNRVEIRMDTLNERSWRVAERAGFTLEGILRQNERQPSGELRDTRIYAQVRLADGTLG